MSRIARLGLGARLWRGLATTRRATDDSVVAREDLGLIEFKKRSPTLPLRPTALLKELVTRVWHNGVLSIISRRQFNKVIRPDTIDLTRIELLAGELRGELHAAMTANDARKVRYLVGTSQLQSRLVRACKRGKAPADPSFPSLTGMVGRLISFQAQPINEARTQLLTQAVVRFDDGSDYILQARSWVRPITWTLQDIQRF